MFQRSQKRKIIPLLNGKRKVSTLKNEDVMMGDVFWRGIMCEICVADEYEDEEG